MHEFTFARSLLRQLPRIVEEQGGGRLREVRLEIGGLSCLDPEQLRFCFEAIARGTAMEETTLTIEKVEPQVRCGNCGYHGRAKLWDLGAGRLFPTLACPNCGQVVEVEGGDQCRIRSVRLAAETRRIGITISGAVQGVGFRPFVHRLAVELGLTGWVRNDAGGLTLEVEGSPSRVAVFRERLMQERPSHAEILDCRTRELPPVGDSDFRIRESDNTSGRGAFILPDLATCPACLRELFDPEDRRYRYPFLNCTECGPRYTIVDQLPYDRARTSMKEFALCPVCQAEYEDPGDRRFHAQPTACLECGPQLSWCNGEGEPRAQGEQALGSAVEALREGRIVALKGIGGFQLCVDARSPEAVARLRARKHRPDKPLAVMAPDLDWVRSHCVVSDLEAEVLTSSAAPILLLRKQQQDCGVAEEVAPRIHLLGVMLAYSPLHHLLLHDFSGPLVATSGNRSGEPICIEETEALQRLEGIADGYLVHNRPIRRAVDDSVVRVMAGKPCLIRRARGYAPPPIRLPGGKGTALAVGGQMKNTVALQWEDQVVVSQHLGDLSDALTARTFARVTEELPRLQGGEPHVVICDLHPDYHSTLFAEQLGKPLHRVQHHVAHAWACVAEHAIGLPVLAVIWDGTGYGEDGTIWGGEFLVLDEEGGSRRLAHLRPFPLPGGEVAVSEPRRAALGLLTEWGGWEAAKAVEHAFTREELALLRVMLERGTNTLRCSSVGRLCDAVASLLGLRQKTTFEGQAAMELEALAEGEGAGGYRMEWREGGLNWAPLLDGILHDLANERSKAQIAAAFHEALVEGLVDVVLQSGLTRVVLSGGCFQNARLLESSLERLEQAGFEVWHPVRLPANDGGLAFGQLAAMSAGR